jgi:fructokinase
VAVVDTIGAGDAFSAGFLAWWQSRGSGLDALDDLASIERAVELAVMVAGVVCTRRGADPPWRHELIDTWLR